MKSTLHRNQATTVCGLMVKHLQQQQLLWQLLGNIFRQLTQLEYIGKNREGWQTFITEEPVAPRPIIAPLPEPSTPGGGLRWSPL